MTVNDLMGLVCDNLPEDWEVQIRMRADEAEVILVDSSGEDEGPEDFVDDDLTPERVVLQRINHARRSDGLSGIDLHGNPDSFCGELDDEPSSP